MEGAAVRALRLASVRSLITPLAVFWGFLSAGALLHRRGRAPRVHAGVNSAWHHREDNQRPLASSAAAAACAQMFAVLLAMGQSIAAAAVPTTTKSTMEQRADTHGALRDVCFVHLYLADMSHFADVNRV